MQIGEIKKKSKKRIGDRAGVYPIYIDESQIFVYMMVPSKKKFGGALPQMGKGGIEKGELPEHAAMREGHEELGLRASNVKKLRQLATDTIEGKKEIYDITVFVAEVFEKDDFDPHGYEAKWSGWVDLEEAVKVSRKNQQHFLRKIQAEYGNDMKIDEITDDDVESRRGQRQDPAEMGFHTIYRACPVEVTDFKPMDYVTKSRRFAIEHSESMYWTEEEPYHVIKAMVRNAPDNIVLYNASNPGEYFYDGPELKGRVIYKAKEYEEYQ